MATTTGTVLLNARGCNINGYDCFVNLSVHNRYYPSTYNGSHSMDSPLSGFSPIIDVRNTFTKFGVSSLFCQNYARLHIDPTNNLTSKTYTVAFWQKIGELKAESALSSSNKWAYMQTSVSGLYSETSIIYNSSRKEIGCNNSSGSWQLITLNYNYNDGNWHHYALTSVNGQVRIFIDGNKLFDQSVNSTSSQQRVAILGYDQLKYIDDVVLIAGDALWTSNFTPPSTYVLDNEYALDYDKLKRRNIIAANVDKKLIIPDDETLKQY